LSTKGFQAVIEKKLASTGNPGNKKQVTAQALRISDQKVRNFPSVSRYTREVAECGFLPKLNILSTATFLNQRISGH
jgi:hypothetical protein